MEDKLIVEDITYGTIELDDVYKKLVETKAFSRLKEITQTGNSYYTFPDLIKIKRYDHSIGAYYTMCKIINRLELELEQYNLQFTEDEKNIAKVAMLLHDIGHSPYSHTTERAIMEFLRKEGRLKEFDKYSHETRTINLIKDEDGEIYKVLKEKWGEEFVNKVVNYLEAAYSGKELKTEKGQLGLLKVLLALTSNNLDADRLDYIDKDSKGSGCKSAMNIDEIINSFTLTLDGDEIKLAIPEDKVYLAETLLFERARNYNNMYYSRESVAGNYVLNSLMNEISKTRELSEDASDCLRKFFCNPLDLMSNDEFIELTDTVIDEELKKIAGRTGNEKLRYLCDMEKATKDFVQLYTNESEEYIRKLLKAEIPELDVENTDAVIDDIKSIKTYKSTTDENINVLTPYGRIKDLRDCYTLVNLEPREKRYVAINPELIRLELGVSKEVFERDYKHKIEDVIRIFNKPEEKFELKYIFLGKISFHEDDVIEKFEESGYTITDLVSFISEDVYYDDITSLKLVKNERILRTRSGNKIARDGKRVPDGKDIISNRITYKESGAKERYSVKRPKEKIVKSVDIIEKYKTIMETLKQAGVQDDELSIDSEILKSVDVKSLNKYIQDNYEALKMLEQALKMNGISPENLQDILRIHNLRFVQSVNVGKAEVEISINKSSAVNHIYDYCPAIGFTTLEISPKNMSDRLAVIEIDRFISEAFPDMERCMTTKSAYELALMHTYMSYKNGHFVSDDADEADKLHGKPFAELFEQRIGDREYQRTLELIKQREEDRIRMNKQWEDFFNR